MSAAYEPRGFCPGCGYRMDAGTCPECGRVVARLAKRHPQSRRRRRLVAALVLLVAAGAGWAGWHYRNPLAARFWPEWHLRQLTEGKGTLASWAWSTLWQRDRLYQDREKPAVDVHEQQIAKELLTLGPHDWAGEYTSGGMNGEQLILSPGAGFVHKTWSCTQTHWNHGEVVRVAAGIITLRNRISFNLHGSAVPQTTLVQVRWGGRRYLIDDSDFVAFANCVNLGDPGARFHYMAHATDRASTRDQDGEDGNPPSWPPGLPDVPADYRKYILSAPIVCEVVTTNEVQSKPTDDGTFYSIVATLNAGARQGVFEGMEFRRLKPDGFGEGFVKSVAMDTCVAELWESAKRGETVQLPQPGWQFTTHEAAFDE
jgi:hypothetical protein